MKCTLDETSFTEPIIKRHGSSHRRKKGNLDGLFNNGNESDDESILIRSGSRRQSKRRQRKEQGRTYRA